jgi:hypothetical protein
MALVGMTLMFHEDAPWNWATLTLASTLFYAIYILGLEECARRTASSVARHAHGRSQALVMCVASGALMLARCGEFAGTWDAIATLPGPALTALAYWA